MQTSPYPRWVLRPAVPEEVYTDRQEFLEYYYESALSAITRRSRSSVLLGHRRMGKTEIFKRVVNRLFWEQDHTDPEAVVPIFFTFPDEILSRKNFALDYVENLIRWYGAFRLRDMQIFSTPKYRHELFDYLNERMEITTGFAIAFDLLSAIERDGATLPEKQALYLPREISDYDDSTIAVFLDEFQNTHLPEYGFRVVGFMQQAVESLTCPHFVTGSAMSILVQDILGRGALFGRFDHEQIEGLTEYWGAELVLRAARYYQVETSEVMAPVIAERCGGNPFYIIAVVRQAAKKRQSLQNDNILNEMLVVDISSGFIWAELHDQVSRWIAKVNEYGITKWILYLAALEEEERINLTRIQEELNDRHGRQVELDSIKEVLVKLSRGDLVEYKSFGDWFGKVEDPILEQFLKVWGRTEVEGRKRRTVQNTLRKQYQTLKKRVDDYKGYLAEVFMVQMLWNSQEKTLPGQYFHVREDISVPRFTYIDQRSRLGAGTGLELDIFAAAGIDVWIAQSKWWSTPVGRPEVEHLLKQAAIVREREGEDLRSLRVWLFAANGVNAPAKDLLEQEGVLWSIRADLDALLKLNGLRTLPDLDADPNQ